MILLPFLVGCEEAAPATNDSVEITELLARIETLEARLAEVEHATGSSSDLSSMSDNQLELDDVMYLNSNGDLVIQGVNVYINSGFMEESELDQKGNLIIGPTTYNENIDGAHNLVVGKEHVVSGYYGIVSGVSHDVQGIGSAVISGRGNTIENDHSVIIGGRQNIITSIFSAINGGEENLIEGKFSSIGGGYGNMVYGEHATVAGGYQNRADAFTSSIAGGGGNRVTGVGGLVAGGFANHAVPPTGRCCHQSPDATKLMPQNKRSVPSGRRL